LHIWLLSIRPKFWSTLPSASSHNLFKCNVKKNFAGNIEPTSKDWNNLDVTQSVETYRISSFHRGLDFGLSRLVHQFNRTILSVEYTVAIKFLRTTFMNIP
jgi:hypothetical protein